MYVKTLSLCIYVCMYVARIYPSLAFKVDEANWNMTKSLMMFRKAVDDDPQNSDFEKFRAEEFIRTGTITLIVVFCVFIYIINDLT